MNQSCKKIYFIIIILTTTSSNDMIIASATSSTNWPIITRSTRSILPPALQQEAENTKLSILEPTQTQLNILYKNYPDGSVLFPNDSVLATKFNTMIKAIQANPNLIEFFRKVQINALNQLYGYIMKIYTNLNLTNPGTVQINGTTTANLMAYLTDDTTYATNKKKLIMNHFLNIIQAQFSATIVSYIPTLPTDLAAAFGQMFIENDCGIDLTQFSQQQTDPTIIGQQATYINFLQQYLDFFHSYTNYLNNLDATGTNQYYTIAQSISNLLNPQSGQTTISMNPSMFFYDIETMRSIQFIPFIAGTIDKNSQLIPWAPSVVNAAINNLTMNGHPIAYFTDAAGNKTQNQSNAAHLYLLTEVGTNLFQEELLTQPGWLNNQNGSIRILSACLGDCSAVVGLGILDTTMETIIQKATGAYQGSIHQAVPSDTPKTTQTKQGSKKRK